MSLITELLSNSVELGSDSVSFAFDNRQLFNSCSTETLLEVADGLWSKMKHLQPELIFGKGLGASPLLTAVKLRAWELSRVDLKILFIRDTRKTTGQFRKLVEGPMPDHVTGLRAVYVDDLFNSGKTFEAAKTTLLEEGFTLDVVGVAVLLDFWSGSRQLTVLGYPFFSLVRRHDLGLSRVDHGLPETFGALLWHRETHHRGDSAMSVKSPAVISDGRVFMGNDDTGLYCYDLETGDRVWRVLSEKPAAKGAACTPAVIDGRVYWGSYDGVVRCADAKTGTVIWAAKAGSHIHSSPCVDRVRGCLYVGTEHASLGMLYGKGDFVALRLSDGEELWRIQTGGMVPCTPELSPDGSLVVCGSNDFHLYAVDPVSGSVKWRQPTKGTVKGRAAFSEDSSVVCTVSDTGWAAAHSADTGAQLWQRRIGALSPHCFPIVEQHRLFATSSKGMVVCLNLPTGEVGWVTQIRGEIGWGLTNLQKSLLINSTSGYIVTLDKATGAKQTVSRLATVSTFQPLAYDPTTKCVVVPTSKGILCYGSDL